MSDKPVKPEATKNPPLAVRFVTQAFEIELKSFSHPLHTFMDIDNEEFQQLLIQSGAYREIEHKTSIYMYIVCITEIIVYQEKKYAVVHNIDSVKFIRYRSNKPLLQYLYIKHNI
jgi:hypothetical protein